MQKNHLINNNNRKRRKMKIAGNNNNKIMRNSMIDVSDADEYEVEDDSRTLDNIDDDRNAVITTIKMLFILSTTIIV